MSTAVAVATAVAVTSAGNTGGGGLGPPLWMLMCIIGMFIFLVQLTEIGYSDPHQRQKSAALWTAAGFWCAGNLWFVNAWVAYDVHPVFAIISGILYLIACICVARMGNWAADPVDIEKVTAEANDRVARRKKMEEQLIQNGMSKFGLMFYDTDSDWFPSEKDVYYAKNHSRYFLLNLLGAVVFTVLANFFLWIY